MNEKLNQAVINAIEEIFQTMLGIKVNSKLPKEKFIDEVKYELNVVISIVGELTGTITLKGTRKLASVIASKMINEEVDEKSDDIMDAIGEFLNIIMGAVMRHYSSDNAFDISVPTVIMGDDYLVYTKASKNDKVSIIDFDNNENHFCIEIYLK